MRYTRGFLTCKDEDTKKEIPFFVRVRNEDISLTKTVNIDECLVKTSGQWILAEVYSDLDATVYRYTHKIEGPLGTESFNNPSRDGHDENLYNLETDCELNYKMYFDGRYEVYGRILLTWNKSITTYYLQLPYSVPNINYQAVTSMGSYAIGWHMLLTVMTTSLTETNYGTGVTKYPFMLNFGWNSHSGYAGLSSGTIKESVAIRFEGRWK